MRILWFVDILFDASPDRITWIEAVRFLQKENEVHLIVRFKNKKEQFKELKSPIIYIESSSILFMRRFSAYQNQIRNFEKFIQKFSPDILLFNTYNFFLLKKAHQLKNKYGYRTVLDIRSLPVTTSRVRRAVRSYFFRKNLRFASREFNGATYITEEMRSFCQKMFRLPEHKSEIWSSGVNIKRFNITKEKTPRKKFTLIYHGNLAKNRGLDSLVKALAFLKSYDIEVLLIGAGSGLTHLKRLSVEWGLESKVNFKPPVPYQEIPNHIQGADAGVLPFPNWEGWNTSSPLKLFEYLACGKPVVATKIPAHWNVLKGKEFVFWAEKNTSEALADAVLRAYEKRNEYEDLSKKAREFVKFEYTWEKQAEKLGNFLKELVHDSKKNGV